VKITRRQLRRLINEAISDLKTIEISGEILFTTNNVYSSFGSFSAQSSDLNVTYYKIYINGIEKSGFEYGNQNIGILARNFYEKKKNPKYDPLGGDLQRITKNMSHVWSNYLNRQKDSHVKISPENMYNALSTEKLIVKWVNDPELIGTSSATVYENKAKRLIGNLIKESIRSSEEGLPMISPETVEKIKVLIDTKNKENETMAASLIEPFYNNLYQIEIVEGDIISVAVRNPKEFVLMDPELLDFMRSFNLKIDNEMPPRSGSEEPPMIPEATLEDPNHTRVYFDFPEYSEDDYDPYDEESSEDSGTFWQDPNRPDRGDYY